MYMDLSTFLGLKNLVLNFLNFLSRTVEHCFHIKYFLIKNTFVIGKITSRLDRPVLIIKGHNDNYHIILTFPA